MNFQNLINIDKSHEHEKTISLSLAQYQNNNRKAHPFG